MLVVAILHARTDCPTCRYSWRRSLELAFIAQQNAGDPRSSCRLQTFWGHFELSMSYSPTFFCSRPGKDMWMTETIFMRHHWSGVSRKRLMDSLLMHFRAELPERQKRYGIRRQARKHVAVSSLFKQISAASLMDRTESTTDIVRCSSVFGVEKPGQRGRLILDSSF